jgi:hypothetical protein
MKRLFFSTFWVFLLAIPAVLPSCSVSYSFSGVNLSPRVKTYTVYYFPNRARLVNPNLSQTFTEGLRDKLQRQTSLNEVQDNGDLIYEGQIVNYDVRPMSVQKDDLAAQNRLTVTVKVKYTNSIDPDQSFEKSFSAYEDFDYNRSLSEAEDDLVEAIVDKLLEDIFNATIANW